MPPSIPDTLDQSTQLLPQIQTLKVTMTSERCWMGGKPRPEKATGSDHTASRSILQGHSGDMRFTGTG